MASYPPGMRYTREHKAEVHGKIVRDAAQRIRARGMTGAAVSAVMKDAGLTHGGFYKHFRNKDELLLESLSAAFREIADRLAVVGEKAPRGTAWKSIVNAYLSPEHCDHPEHGCPLAALAPELAHAECAMKERIAAAMRDYRDRLLPFIPGRRASDRERNFLTMIATMIGAIAIARILPDRAGRERVLKTARQFLLKSF